jgi:type II secretory pathway component PulC
MVALLVTACGETTPLAASPHLPTARSARSTSTEGAVTSPVTPITSLRRAQVKETIAQGLGVFLQNVTVDDWPVMHDGKFYGFRIRTLNTAWGVDLRPGDVVTRINGIVPEHPEEADAALRSLEKATTLRVEFEREGQPKTLELPIVD